MSLQEDVKARTVALISQQMAEWVVSIQRSIGDHQANLVKSLDELQEQVARYDEQLDEAQVGAAIEEVLAGTERGDGAAAAGGADLGRVRGSVAEIEQGANLSEVLTHLVNEVARYVDRAAMFIVKGPNAIGWYAKGFSSADQIKQVSVPLAADTVLKGVNTTRLAVRTTGAQSPATGQAVAKLGASPQGIVAVPLILRDKLAAILYCETDQPEVDAATADSVELLVLFAGKSVDLLSLGAKPPTRAAAPAAAPAPAPPRPAAPPPPPPPAAAPPADEGSSTVMFNPAQMAAMRQAATAQAAPAAPAMSPEQQKAHDDAKRFARLVVSEIKLYNEAKVNEGRAHKDVYERLKEDIERGRQMYADRVPAAVRDNSNYFYDELVRILAGGDPSALGPM